MSSNDMHSVYDITTKPVVTASILMDDISGLNEQFVKVHDDINTLKEGIAEERKERISLSLFPSVRRYGQLKYEASSSMLFEDLATSALTRISRFCSLIALMQVCPMEPDEPRIISSLIAFQIS